MVAPMVLAAGIGAAGSALGGVMGGKGAKKAAKIAAKSQEKVAMMNNALVQGMYNSNAARLDPYIQSGTRANNVLMELLLGPASAGVGGTGGAPGGSWTGGPSAEEQLDFLLNQSRDPIGPVRTAQINAFQGSPQQKLDFAISLIREKEMPYWNQYQAAHPKTWTPTPTAPATPGGTAGPSSALSAWDQFRNSTNYNWRKDQGMDAVQHSFVGQPLDSGAEKIALLEYGQNYASNELGNWMNMLAGQQGIGLQAGGALAGVGMNATNAQMANNQNAANAQGNAALIAGQANQNMWGSIGQGIGQIAGAWGSSYGQPGGGGGGSPIVTSYQNPAYNGGSAWGY